MNSPVDVIAEALRNNEVLNWVAAGSSCKAAIAIHQALSRAGLVIVPVEPTAEMVEAGRREVVRPMVGSAIIRAYNAMLAAYTAKPASEDRLAGSRVVGLALSRFRGRRN